MEEDFRKTIYASYKSARDAPLPTPEEYKIASFNYSEYFKGMLPKDKEAHCLELGCGEGGLLYFLKEQGYRHITGVDVSGEQIERAKNVHRDVVQKDISEYLDQSEDEKYDIIFLIHVIEHFYVSEGIELLEKIFTKLKPGGRIMLQLPCADGPMSTSSLYIDPTHVAHYTAWAFQHVLGMIGFQNIQVRPARPVGRTIKGKIRKLLWLGIEIVFKMYDLIEIGTCAGRTYTRSMSVMGFKPEH